jgi:hypothetical protein
MNNCFANSPLRPLEHTDNILSYRQYSIMLQSSSIDRNCIKTKSPRRIAQGFV